MKLTGGEFRTWQELIIAAIDARTFVAMPGMTAVQVKAAYKAWFIAKHAAETFINPAANIYMIDAFKGVLNGVTTQATWAAGDFTAVPGGGELLTEGKRHGHKFELGSRVVYSAVDVTIYLDVVLV